MFVERKEPHFFDSHRRYRAKEDAVNDTGIDSQDFSPPGGRAQEPLPPNDSPFTIGRTAQSVHPPTVIRRYRSKEESWARARRKNVPKRVLEDLLAAWRERENGLTPAEYGAAFVGPSQVFKVEWFRGRMALRTLCCTWSERSCVC